MRLTSLLTLLCWPAMTSSLASAASTPPLMPEPSMVQWGLPAIVPAKGTIVLSAQAGPPERHAAELLKSQIQRRLGLTWDITDTADAPASGGLRVVMGQPKTFPALERLCAEAKLEVPEQSDGYAVSVRSKDGAVTAIVAGNNARGVAYGQDTLFQLFSSGGPGSKEITVHCATIRDWPTIAMRGRPHPHYEYFFKPENFEIAMRSRINFIDVRDGIYAFEPGTKIKSEEIGKIIRQARERDLIVFAVVNCGVPADQYDAVIASFKEFLDLGANALWLSFDDKGPGADPVEITKRVLALGKERGISGDCIGITPPKGSYQTVITPFNQKIVQVPGMEYALWYWTSIPSPEDTADGHQIGLKTLPSWWHNWPRYREGSLGGGRGYNPVISLAEGWNHPTDKELTEAGKYARAVLPWDGTQLQQDYIVPVIGWWSWRPEKHDIKAVRRRIYDIVFGPTRVEAAFAFDDQLNEVLSRLHFTLTHSDYAPQCPPRLRSAADREQVLVRVAEMASHLEKILARDAGSLLTPELREEQYLGPMKRAVDGGRGVANAPFPEYWYPEAQAGILNAVHDRNRQKAEELIGAARPRILKDLAEVERLLGPSGLNSNYGEWWKKRAAAKPEDYEQLISGRRAELLERMADYGKTVAPFDGMMKNLKDPPIQLGTGAWERHNHVLATVLPENREVFWGDWIGGVVEKNGVKAVAFALDRHVMVEEGAWAELPLNIPISGRRDRLALVIYLADINKESFGLGYAKWRWAGYRAMRLIWNDKDIWKVDLGIPRPTGEWVVVPLPALPDDLKTLSLRMRIEDYASAKNNFEIVYVGPVRLLELDRN